MTNPRLTKTTPKENRDYKDRSVLTTEEIDLMITRANTVYDQPYFRLRARCLVALLRKFGKRRCARALDDAFRCTRGGALGSRRLERYDFKYDFKIQPYCCENCGYIEFFKEKKE